MSKYIVLLVVSAIALLQFSMIECNTEDLGTIKQPLRFGK
uniref:U-limacoditoxin(13)-As54 n=1 Tax=Acharia stimulea TaxID=691692 RepID=RF54_ACHST|nr:RecName: Full=U-limacoditoxin(13)-As54; Short=U-LCTX(13)-As54; Flags: Precursor [Acharia stimulea]WDQ26749.1 venom peptide [Acharia stimulea]